MVSAGTEPGSFLYESCPWKGKGVTSLIRKVINTILKIIFYTFISDVSYTLFLKERLIFGLKLNVLNILRISASNVLKMFLNIVVSIGCTFVIFHSHNPTGSTIQSEVQSNRKYNPTGSVNTLNGISRYPGRQENNRMLNKKI